MTADDVGAALRQAFRMGSACARLRDSENPDDQLRAGELEERLVLLSEHMQAAARAAGLDSGARTLDGGLVELKRDAERAIVEASLHRHGGNVTHAARQLGVSRMTLYRMVRKHGLELPREGSSPLERNSLPVVQQMAQVLEARST